MLMFFFFNDTAPTEIYTLSLHDALPIFDPVSSDALRSGQRQLDEAGPRHQRDARHRVISQPRMRPHRQAPRRSEEHTSELQSRQYLVCRLLLEKKNNQTSSECPALPGFN